MHLVDVDAIGLQPAHGVVDLLEDARSRGVAINGPMAPFDPDLGRDRDAFAQAAFRERPADDIFGTPKPVSRRGVDHIDAVVDRGANRG